MAHKRLFLVLHSCQLKSSFSYSSLCSPIVASFLMDTGHEDELIHLGMTLYIFHTEVKRCRRKLAWRSALAILHCCHPQSLLEMFPNWKRLRAPTHVSSMLNMLSCITRQKRCKGYRVDHSRSYLLSCPTEGMEPTKRDNSKTARTAIDFRLLCCCGS
jgi:hypothetical protein